MTKVLGRNKYSKIAEYTKYCNRKSKMTLLRRHPISCIGDVTFKLSLSIQQKSAIILETPLATVVGFHLHYIFMEPLSMLVTYCCKVLREKI